MSDVYSKSWNGTSVTVDAWFGNVTRLSLDGSSENTLFDLPYHRPTADLHDQPSLLLGIVPFLISVLLTVMQHLFRENPIYSRHLIIEHGILFLVDSAASSIIFRFQDRPPLNMPELIISIHRIVCLIHGGIVKELARWTGIFGKLGQISR